MAVARQSVTRILSYCLSQAFHLLDDQQNMAYTGIHNLALELIQEIISYVSSEMHVLSMCKY